MPAVALALLLALSAAPEAIAASTPPDDALIGIWTARNWFGPLADGPLVIERNGKDYTADMVGVRTPMRVAGQELMFELESGHGSFRGRIEPDGSMRGFWLPPGLGTGGGLASPVRLKADGPNRWRGEVVPPENSFTFHLLVTRRSDGLLRAVLRNPDRDWGTYLGVERIALARDSVKLFGRRPGQTEAREVAGGTYDSTRKVIQITTRGSMYEFRRDGDQSAYWPRGRTPARYVYRPPLQRDDGWPTGTLEEARISRAGMERFVQAIVDMPMDSSNTPQIHGFLVARHGKLVFEEYFHGESRDRLHDTRSAAKSLTAVMVGAAMHAGAPLSLGSPVYQVMNGGTFPADLEPRKRAMTLEHLLTMSAGYYCDDTDPRAPGREDTMTDDSDEPDYYKYTLAVPMATAPGEKAVYCSGVANLALGVLGRATGESPLYTFDRLVAQPLAIDRYGFPLDRAGQPYGGGSVYVLPRDFMKLGQLMLNGGTWQGRRILDRDFVAKASSRLYHLRNIYYGYLWWAIDFPYKDRTVAAYYAGGNGGQGVVVIPELDLVIATYGANYNTARSTIHITQELIPQYILPSVRVRGDDMNATVVQRPWRTPYGRSPNGGPVAGASPSR